MTLRISPAHLQNEVKPIPHLVEWVYNNYTTRRDGYIRHYLKVKKGVETLFAGLSDTEGVANDGTNRPNRTRQQRTVNPLTERIDLHNGDTEEASDDDDRLFL